LSFVDLGFRILLAEAPPNPEFILTTMAFAAAALTTGTSPEYIAKMTVLASRAFVTDGFPVIVLRERYGLTRVTREDLARHYGDRISAKVEAGATIFEAGNWAAAALWQPPIERSSPVEAESQPEQTSPTLADFLFRSDSAREKHLGKDRPYYYLSLMGRAPGRTEKGAVRAVLEPYISRAKSEGVPIWLEAGTERGRDVYSYFGFETVDMIVSGKGSYNIDGIPVEGGEGVPTWLMMLDASE